MKKILFIHFLLISVDCIAQKNKPVFKGSDRKLAVFMNMFSLLEPQQGAIGAGINYKIVNRWDISLELNYLFEGFVQSEDDNYSKGYRAIFTTKRFSKSGIFFYGLDARIKHFSYIDEQNFVNHTTNDTLHRFSHKANTTLPGAAGIVGVRLPISKNKRWAIEINTGIGAKYRFIKRENIPPGYTYDRVKDFKRQYDLGQDQEGTDIYFPSAIRIMYFF